MNGLGLRHDASRALRYGFFLKVYTYDWRRHGQVRQGWGARDALRLEPWVRFFCYSLLLH